MTTNHHVRMARSDTPEKRQRIELVENPSGTWTATDKQTGVASQGETRIAALENLDEAVALYHGEIGHEPTDKELRDLGVDPDVARSQGDELPDVLE
jgi:predicted RNase H-like HicB family nuclease